MNIGPWFNVEKKIDYDAYAYEAHDHRKEPFPGNAVQDGPDRNRCTRDHKVSHLAVKNEAEKNTCREPIENGPFTKLFQARQEQKDEKQRDKNVCFPIFDHSIGDIPNPQPQGTRGDEEKSAE